MKQLYRISSRIILLGFFILLLHGKSYGQAEGQESTGSPTFSIPSNTGKGGGTVTLGGIPVNLYTGTASPGMGLYTLPSRGLAASVSLSYTAGNGLPVVSRASEVGTGWQLNAGGQITCEVRGTPDELVTSDKNWLLDLANHTNNVRWIQDKLCGREDTEYDIYHASALGLQVDFVVRGPSGASNDVIVHVLNDQQVKVAPKFATWGNRRRVVSFTVTDGNGIKYVFDESSQTRIYSQTRDISSNALWPASDITYTSDWKLTNVTSLNGDNIYFNYETGNAAPITYKTFIQRYKAFQCDANGNNCSTYGPRRSRTSDGAGTGGSYSAQRINSDYETTITVSRPYAKYLSTIYSDAGRIRFVRGKHQRRDALGESALSEVQVLNRNERIVKRFVFDYGYFGSSTVTDPDQLRLKLIQVKEQAEGCAAASTRFLYKEMGSMARLTASRDYWGYLTIDNQPFVNRVKLDPRTPDATAMQNCLLYQISSSAGGSTELEYEPHLDGNGKVVGGVRVKKVTVRDGYRAAADQVFEVGYTTFDRNNPSQVGGPSAGVVTPPLFQEYQLIRTQGKSLCDSQDDVVSKFFFSSSDALEPIAPDYIGYKWASIKFPNRSRSVYKFTNQVDYPDTFDNAAIKLSTNPYATDEPCHASQKDLPGEWTLGCGQGDPLSPQNRGTYTSLPPVQRPYGIVSSAAHRRGILLEQIDLDSESRPVTLVENTYDFSQRDAVIRSAVVGKEQEVFAHDVFNYYYNIKFYQLEKIWIPLQKQLITSYDQRRGNTLTIVQSQQQTKYEYINFMVSDINVSNPAEGREYKTRLTRVADYTPSPWDFNPTFLPGIGELYYGGSLMTIVGTDQFVKPTRSSAWQHLFQTEKEYLVQDGKPLLKRTMSYDYVAGGAQPTGQPSALAVEYDDKGNLTNALGTQGVWGGTIWGYNRLLPIASVVNGRVSTTGSGSSGVSSAGHTSFENYDDDGWSIGTFTTTEAKTGKQSVVLSTPNSIYGPGKVFTLTPAEQHGKYSFSCWAKVPKNESGQTNVIMVGVINTPNGGSFWKGKSTVLSANEDWQLCRVVIDLNESAIQAGLTTNGNITIQCYPWLNWGSGNVLVDEMRFHSENARMTTTTYEPFIGKTSMTDENQVTTYFLYDASNELRLVKDAKGNIVKRLKSHMASTPDLTITVTKSDGNLHPSTSATFMASVPECVDGVTYTWNFGDGTTQKGGAQQAHTYAQIGNYALTVVAEAADVNPVEAAQTIQVVAPMSVSASYYGTTYYDLCSSYWSERSARITAQPTAGCGGYSYRWQTSEYQQLGGYWTEWADAGNTSDTYPYYHSSARNLQVRCIVTDACGNTAELYDSFYTYYSDPRCGTAVEFLQVSPSTSTK